MSFLMIYTAAATTVAVVLLVWLIRQVRELKPPATVDELLEEIHEVAEASNDESLEDYLARPTSVSDNRTERRRDALNNLHGMEPRRRGPLILDDEREAEIERRLRGV